MKRTATNTIPASVLLLFIFVCLSLALVMMLKLIPKPQTVSSQAAYDSQATFALQDYSPKIRDVLSVQPPTKEELRSESKSTIAKYKYKSLGTLGGPLAIPLSLNENNFVTGFSRTANGHERAFIWNPQTSLMEPLAFSLPNESCNSYGTGINDKEHISGYYSCAGQRTSFIFNYHTSEITLLSDLVPENQTTEAFNLNNLELVVGRSADTAVYWNNKGTVTDLAKYLPEGSSFLTKMNSAQTSIGNFTDEVNFIDYGAFLFYETTLRPTYYQFPRYLNTDSVFVLDINDEGTVVGYGFNLSNASQYRYPFTWSKGEYRSLPQLNNSTASRPRSINSQGKIVGFSAVGSGGSGRGVYWENEVISDLNRITGGIPANRIIMEGVEINDRGNIVGLLNDFTPFILTTTR